MRKIAILGSTGSIGRQALDICRWFKDEYTVTALTGGANVELLAAQAKEFTPALVVTANDDKYAELKALLPGFKGRIAAGEEAVTEAAILAEADTVLGAISGIAGLLPIWQALKAGKRVCLANKEVLVAAGAEVMALVNHNNLELLPVDSEHSAIFQCLRGNGDAVDSLLITASGGPFRGQTLAQTANYTPAEALAHPTWAMGPKISVDSASLMNKGLEVIEAHWLFNIPYDRIKVVVHPQSIIHSLVQYGDGSILAHLGPRDMRIPIQFALSWPKRLANPLKKLDLTEVANLSFEPPDLANFPCLALAYEAGQKGGTYAAALNGANEELVCAFLKGQITFGQIGEYNKKVLSRHQSFSGSGLAPYIAADQWAREVLKKDYLKN